MPFEPWVGSEYGMLNGKTIRLMILGESHYGKPADDKPSFTNEMVLKRAVERPRRFFTIIHRLVTGGRGTPSRSEREQFWHSVMFCNYIQRFVGTSARIKPTPTMWSDAVTLFESTINKHTPQAIIVLGHRLFGHVKENKAIQSIGTCAVHHPSYPGFSYSLWQPKVKELLASVE